MKKQIAAMLAISVMSAPFANASGIPYAVKSELTKEGVKLTKTAWKNRATIAKEAKKAVKKSKEIIKKAKKK